MFKTIGNTWALIGASWRVLNQDRKLLLFPIMSGLAVVVVVLVAAGAFAVTGSYDEDSGISTTGYVIGAAFYLAATFLIIYFNAALIAAAHQLIKGGSPTVSSALQVANSHLPTIFGWACFSTTIGLLIEQLRNGDGFVFKIIAWVLSAIWAYMTYFVVPVLVLEGLSPLAAVKRSSALFKQTWGNQAVSNFGFGLAYVVVIVIAVVPTLVALTAGTALAIVVGLFISLPMLVAGCAVLASMEGIFRAALYEYASSGSGSMFPDEVLRRAYVSKGERGSWGNGNWGSGGSAHNSFETRQNTDPWMH
jgi:hypothetical protein